MKKIISIFCILALVLNISLVNVFAQDNNETVSSTTRSEETTITNVFLSIKQQEYFLKKSLKNNSIYSFIINDELKQVQKRLEEFPKHIYQIKKEFNNQELYNAGYNDKQIEAIRNYDGSYEMSIAASATISATPTKVSYTRSNNQTRFSGKVEFVTNGILDYYFTNYAGISIFPSINSFAPISTRTGTITHVDLTNGTTVTSSATADGDDGVNGAYRWKFPTVRTISNVHYRINKAVFTFSSYSQGYADFVTMRYSYGFVNVSLTTNVGISFSDGNVTFGIGITPKANTVLYPSNPDDRVRVYNY